MNPRWVGFFAPFRWLIAALDVGRHQPGLLLGAVACVVAVEVVPGMLAQAGGPASTTTVVLMQLLGLLVGLLVAPVLKAGVYAVIDAGEREQPLGFDAVFAGFSDGRYPALVGVSVLGLLLFVAIGLVMVLVAALTGAAGDLPGIAAWMEQVQALQAEAGAGTPVPPERFPPLPEGLVGLMLLGLAFAPLLLVAGLTSAWALVGVALRGLGPLAALLLALRAAVVNAPAVLVFILVLLLPGLLLGGLLGLLLGGLAALAGLAGAAVGQMVMALLLLGAMVLFSAVFYGFLWQGWRAACDPGAQGPATAPPPPADAGSADGRFEA